VKQIFLVLKCVAFEAAIVLKGTKHWHSQDNYKKQFNTVFPSVFIVVLVMNTVTVRCGVRIEQAVRIRYTQTKQNMLHPRSSRCSGQRYVTRSME
jgi:hypothetical protein